MTLVSGNIRFMRIFAAALWRGGVKRQWVIENVDFQGFGRYVFGILGNEANIIIHRVRKKTPPPLNMSK